MLEKLRNVWIFTKLCFSQYFNFNLEIRLVINDSKNLIVTSFKRIQPFFKFLVHHIGSTILNNGSLIKCHEN